MTTRLRVFHMPTTWEESDVTDWQYVGSGFQAGAPAEHEMASIAQAYGCRFGRVLIVAESDLGSITVREFDYQLETAWREEP